MMMPSHARSKMHMGFLGDEFLAIPKEHGLDPKLSCICAGSEGKYAPQKALEAFYTFEVRYALQRIAHYQGISQQKVLENLIYAADKEILQSLKPGTPEWARYYDI